LKPNILIIDNDAELCGVLEEFLRAGGYEVLSAIKGKN